MVLRKSSLHTRSEFTITCQQCTRVETITPDQVENSDRIVKIFGMKRLYIYQCACGARFNLEFDFRRKPRHSRDLTSFYTTLTESNYRRQMGPEGQRTHKTVFNSSIKNISVDGIGLMTNDSHNIQIGDELLVKIIINRGGTDRLITRRVKVRNISGKYIGAEFFPEDKKDPEIGFYLMTD
jgi:hypothetical protein